jgi:hypothetical protein
LFLSLFLGINIFFFTSLFSLYIFLFSLYIFLSLLNARDPLFHSAPFHKRVCDNGDKFRVLLTSALMSVSTASPRGEECPVATEKEAIWDPKAVWAW